MVTSYILKDVWWKNLHTKRKCITCISYPHPFDDHTRGFWGKPTSCFSLRCTTSVFSFFFFFFRYFYSGFVFVLCNSLNPCCSVDLSYILVSYSVCNYAKGKWVADKKRPLYSGSECKHWLSSMWACRLMDRSDFSFEGYRWQPRTRQ